VAVVQIVLAHNGLTPWKGGGFGMFSTLDHTPFRRLVVVIDGPARSETLDIPSSLELDAARAAQWPADWLLRRLAAGVVARERRYDREVDKVTVTAWQTEFDSATLQGNEKLLRRFVYEPR
jgi:hypothetical protein